MLHEILLSLWGCSTSIDAIIKNDLVDFDKYLHPGERVLVERILETVREFKKIVEFINGRKSVSDCLEQGDADELEVHHNSGLYLKALRNGMDEALTPYREDIIDLENIVLKDPHTPLGLILCRVKKYDALFGILNRCINEIKRFKLHGCQLLQCLHDYKHVGMPGIKTALEKIVHSVHVIFYKHLTDWLLYGHLEDAHNEFFIRRGTESAAEDDGIMLSDAKSPLNAKSVGKKRHDNETWNFNVKADMVPSYIRPSLASKILTIGQTVIMFGNDPRDEKKDFNVKNNMNNPIWGEREYEYYQKLQKLQSKATFDTIALESTVNEMKKCVTELLWHIAVEEAQLFQQLRFIKDFYLVGRGDFYLEFIKLTSHVLSKTPTSHTSRDINLAFRTAMRKLQVKDETILDSFTITVPVTESSESHQDPVLVPDSLGSMQISEEERQDPFERRGWGLIVLNYKVAWPLDLLFGPTAFSDYNVLFRFLLRVKKTQIDLSNLWIMHKRSQKLETGVLELRNNLIFIIDNLQYYLQVDVLESQYTIMENRMKNTRNFEDIQKAHSIFLANVMSQTFLSGRTTERRTPVNKLIRLLLRLCDDFVLQTSIWEVENLLTNQREELKTLSDTLNSLMIWLLETLKAVRAQPSGEHLAQLLLRLDFNRWFSSKV